ncbi:MAG: hypothetical protein K0S20_572 [Patescibacteria group bacterium]|nr:hypothetical protein [Patescibacteria group bacterium]
MKGDQSKGLNVLVISLLASLVGALYFSYISAVSFPPDIVRIVPFVWLVLSFWGLIGAIQATRSKAHRYMVGLAVMILIPNIVLAALFCLGSLMGD